MQQLNKVIEEFHVKSIKGSIKKITLETNIIRSSVLDMKASFLNKSGNSPYKRAVKRLAAGISALSLLERIEEAYCKGELTTLSVHKILINVDVFVNLLVTPNRTDYQQKFLDMKTFCQELNIRK